MACVLVPSVTLYGTTQVSALRTITQTITTTYLGEPAITLQTLTSTVCDASGSNCQPEIATSLVTITPTVTTTIYSTETRSGLITSVVPQQTLYYPCSTTAAPSASETRVAETSTAAESSGAKGTHASAATRTAASTTTPASSLSPSDSSLRATSPGTTSAALPLVTSGAAAEPHSLSRSVDPASPADSPGTAFSSCLPSPSPSPSTTFSSSPESKAPTIAGAVVGTLAGLVLVCLLFVYCRRKRRRATGSSSKSIGTLDYWERRFRELEADQGNDVEKETAKASSQSPLSPDQPPSSISEVKKLRLTLDLHSKAISTRPASRLSVISSFFSSKPVTTSEGTGHIPAVPVPFAAGQGKSGFNFSRPRFGKRQSATSGISRVSGPSGCANPSKHGANVRPHSRKSTTSLSKRIRAYASTVTPSESGRSLPGDSGGERGRAAMDWVRPSDQRSTPPSTPSLLLDRGDSFIRASSPEDGQAPLKRSTFGTTPVPTGSEQGRSPLSSTATSTSIGRRESLRGSADSSSSDSSTVVSFFAPAPAEAQPAPPAEVSAPQGEPSSPPNRSPPARAILTPPMSFAAHRQPSPSRKGAPELLSSPDAFSPSLWVDEDVYEQFRLANSDDLGAASARAPQSDGQRREPRFSPDSSMPALSALPITRTDEPYGGIADAAVPPVQPAYPDPFDHPLHAYRRRADSACSSVPPSAAIPHSGSTSTFEDDAASVSFGRAWRASIAQTFERSAVTPQLPVVKLSDSPIFADGLGLSEADRGTEERMQTMYHVE